MKYTFQDIYSAINNIALKKLLLNLYIVNEDLINYNTLEDKILQWSREELNETLKGTHLILKNNSVTISKNVCLIIKKELKRRKIKKIIENIKKNN